jgi:uncharacterized Zn-binding protein involved in type VI secretion
MVFGRLVPKSYPVSAQAVALGGDPLGNETATAAVEDENRSEAAPLGRRLPKCHWPIYPAGYRFAARVADMQAGPMFTGPVLHVGGVLAAPAAQGYDGDRRAPCTVIKGSAMVIVGGLPTARTGDSTSHGGVITLGCMTVLIGAE